MTCLSILECSCVAMGSLENLDAEQMYYQLEIMATLINQLIKRGMLALAWRILISILDWIGSGEFLQFLEAQMFNKFEITFMIIQKGQYCTQLFDFEVLL